MRKEHETTPDCWCHPDEFDGVVVHRDDLGYALYELTIIGDILVDYDGYRTTESLMKLCDEIRARAYEAVDALLAKDGE